MAPDRGKGAAALRWLPPAAWLLMALPAFAVWPAFDDWLTSVPLACDGSQTVLRPVGFWRPLEALYRTALGCRPELYPWTSHLLTVLFHGVAVGAVALTARRLGARRGPTAVAAALFATSPAVAAAVWSVDGTIQTASTALGLCSLLALLGGGRRAVPLWLALATLSLACKESGAAWFLIPPLLQRTIVPERGAPDGRRSPSTTWLWGVGALVLYAAVRVALADGLPFGFDSPRYGVRFDPWGWARRAALLLGVAVSSTDTLAWTVVPRRLGWGLATGLAGLPLLVLALAWIPRRLATRETWGWAAAALLAAAPHLVIGRISEMYAHPVLAVIVLAVARAAPDAAGRTGPILAALAFAAASLASDAHKARAMIDSGRAAREVGRSLAAQWSGPPPRSLCGVVPLDPGPGYSVFTGSAAAASGWGKSVLAEWSYDPAIRFFHRDDEAGCRAAGADAVVGLDGSPRWLR